MHDNFVNVNWLAVLVATAAAFALGGTWYSRALFGKTWMQEIGLTEQAIENGRMRRILASTFVLQFIAAGALATFLGPHSNWLLGLHAGLMVAVLWVATSLGINYLFEQRSLRLFCINAGYNVVLFATMGVILGSWP